MGLLKRFISCILLISSFASLSIAKEFTIGVVDARNDISFVTQRSLNENYFYRIEAVSSLRRNG